MSNLFETCERSDLNLATSAGVPKVLAALKVRSRSRISTRRSGETHGFSLFLIVIWRTGAKASNAVVIALVNFSSMASTVGSVWFDEKDSAFNCCRIELFKAFKSTLFSWRDKKLSGGGRGAEKDILNLKKS